MKFERNQGIAKKVRKENSEQGRDCQAINHFMPKMCKFPLYLPVWKKKWSLKTHRSTNRQERRRVRQWTTWVWPKRSSSSVVVIHSDSLKMNLYENFSHRQTRPNKGWSPNGEGSSSAGQQATPYSAWEILGTFCRRHSTSRRKFELTLLACLPERPKTPHPCERSAQWNHVHPESPLEWWADGKHQWKWVWSATWSWFSRRKQRQEWPGGSAGGRRRPGTLLQGTVGRGRRGEEYAIFFSQIECSWCVWRWSRCLLWTR